MLALTLRGASFHGGRLRFGEDLSEPVTVTTVADEPGEVVAHERKAVPLTS